MKRLALHSRTVLALLVGAVFSTINLQLSTALAQGTAFTYQGKLAVGGNATNGVYDFTFKLWNASSSGSTIAGPVTNSTVGVTNGLFTVTLDFGAGAFPGADRWLDIGVRTNGSADAFQTLSPRQPLTATPYATRAANFSGAVSDAQLSANVARLNANQTFSGMVNFNNTSNNYAGSFSGNATGVTNAVNGDLWHLNRWSWHNTLRKIVAGQPIQIMVFGEGGHAWDYYYKLLGHLFRFYNFNGSLGAGGGNLNYWEVTGPATIIDPTTQSGATNWYKNYGKTDNGGFITMRRYPDSAVVGNVLEVDYLAVNGAGTFKIQTNINNGPWTDVAGYTNVNADNGGARQGVSIRLTNDITAPFKLRVAGLSGLVEFVGLGIIDLTQSGIIQNDFAQPGGGHWTQFFGTTNWAGPILRTWSPDLIIYCELDRTNIYAQYLPKWHQFMSTWLPNSDFVLLNNQPDIEDEAITSYLPSLEARTNCLNFHWGYFDTYNIYGGLANGLRNGLLYPSFDAGPTPAGSDVIAYALFDWLGLANNANSGPVPDARLSVNVALRVGGNSFTGNQFVTGGNVGIGTASPGFTLEVNGSAGKPGGGTWSMSSDARLKKNIHPLAGALDKLLALRGVNFEYVDPAKVHELSGERMGLIAQEVEKVFPDWVETGADGYKRVTVRGLEALTVEALRQLRAEKDGEVAELKARLEKLERLLNEKNGGAK